MACLNLFDHFHVKDVLGLQDIHHKNVKERSSSKILRMVT